MNEVTAITEPTELVQEEVLTTLDGRYVDLVKGEGDERPEDEVVQD